MKKVAEQIAEFLKQNGVQYVFGVPSGPWTTFMDAFRAIGMEFVLVSNEASAGFMAEVSGRLTGVPGVCYGTLGPGATNLSTGVGGALLDRSPLIAFTTEPPDSMMGRTTQMAIDHQTMFKSITKWTTRLSADRVQETLQRAVEIARKYIDEMGLEGFEKAYPHELSGGRLIVWELIGRLEIIFLIPPFVDVVKAVVNLFTTAKFYTALAISVQSFAVGVGLAVVIGIPLGLLMGRVKFIDELLGMWVNVFVSAPLTAIVPALMVIVGFGQSTVIVTVLLFSMWIITLDTRAGVKNINPSLLEMTRSFGAKRIKVYTKIIFWAALPEILAGLRLGLIRAVRGVVVGQLLIAIMGIGELFELYSRNFLMDRFWALVIFIFLFAYAVSELVNRLEHRVEFYAGTR